MQVIWPDSLLKLTHQRNRNGLNFPFILKMELVIMLQSRQSISTRTLYRKQEENVSCNRKSPLGVACTNHHVYLQRQCEDIEDHQPSRYRVKHIHQALELRLFPCKYSMFSTSCVTAEILYLCPRDCQNSI